MKEKKIGVVRHVDHGKTTLSVAELKAMKDKAIKKEKTIGPTTTEGLKPSDTGLSFYKFTNQLLAKSEHQYYGGRKRPNYSKSEEKKIKARRKKNKAAKKARKNNRKKK